MWAEKEMRNLRRLEAAGIRCPRVLFLRAHILLMEFIGKNGWCAQHRELVCQTRVKFACRSSVGASACSRADVTDLFLHACGLGLLLG